MKKTLLKVLSPPLAAGYQRFMTGAEVVVTQTPSAIQPALPPPDKSFTDKWLPWAIIGSITGLIGVSLYLQVKGKIPVQTGYGGWHGPPVYLRF